MTLLWQRGTADCSDGCLCRLGEVENWLVLAPLPIYFLLLIRFIIRKEVILIIIICELLSFKCYQWSFSGHTVQPNFIFKVDVLW